MSAIAIAGASLDASAIIMPSYADTIGVQLTELEVKAARRSNGLTSISPKHTIDSEKIVSTGITDISDALRRLPGINLRDYGGSGGMKTVSVRGFGAQHTGVSYDGAPATDVQGGQIDLSRYSLDNLAGITLLLGDDDEIWTPARSASSASMLMVNTIGSPDLMQQGCSGALKLRYASFETLNPFLRVSLSNGSNLGMTLNGEFLHAKNDYPFTLRNGDQVSRERRNNSLTNFGHAEWNGVWTPTPGSRLAAKAYYYQSDRHLPGPVVYYNDKSNQRLNDLTAFGQLSYSTRLSRIFSLKALAKCNWADTRYRDEDGRYPGGKLDQKYHQREQYITASLLATIPKGFQLSYSADYWHNSLLSNLKSDSNPTRDSFLQALSAKWGNAQVTATAKGLLSIISDKSESIPDGKREIRFSPSAGVSVKPLRNEQWRLRASYKELFRMPTFNELYFDHYGSVNLNPELTRQLNIGTTWSHNFGRVLPYFEITIDGYWNQIRNKIVAMPYNTFLMTMTNLGKVRTLGFDATLAADFHIADKQMICLSGNYSYQRAETRTSPDRVDWMKQVAYTPLNSGAWSLTWKNPWVNLVVHGTGASAKYSTNTNVAGTRIPGYMEVGLTIYRSFDFNKIKLDLRGDVTNLFDKQYEIIARYPMPGRSFSLSAALLW